MEDKYDLIPESGLVEQARNGSKEAFCRLYGNYKVKLYRYALYRLGHAEDAEDAVSECVLAAWQGLPGLENPEAFGAWIFRILYRCCMKKIRDSIGLRDNMERIYREGAGSPAGHSGETPLASLELNEALAILSDEEREIVLLAVIAGLTSNEISEITSLTPGSVRSKLSRSLSKMREFLS